MHLWPQEEHYWFQYQEKTSDPCVKSPVSALLLVLMISGSSNAESETGGIQFMEAPFFSNSLHCPDPARDNKSINQHPSCRQNIINIAMTLDETYLRGSMAAILSIIYHTACPQNLHFHFIYSRAAAGEDSLDLNITMAASFPYLQFDMYAFDDETVSGRISTSVRRALDRPLNYARSYLAQLLPDCVQRVVYLDSDVILVDDIAKLWSTDFVSSESVIAAPEYCETDISRYFTTSFWSNAELSSTFKGRTSKACYFNTGVMVIELQRWRAKDYTRGIEEWMELQKRMRIYELGSLPPFLLVFAGEILAVEPRWNQHGLGGDNYEGHCRGLHPGAASLLHWSGRGKPWVRLDSGRPCPVDALWAPYDMLKKPFPALHLDV
ncbi:hypothetical protein J5N97_005510 [Dioscorea zingiberensis]|uniref:Hexosyltransferase n=1 Tax=Dioscorea zingiberensis TaxID=325984 RepID=A0A9D5HSD7_9LILI|nr:hypothetical protein J5N97_005510 [Dioscorea zingiberensis]